MTDSCNREKKISLVLALMLAGSFLYYALCLYTRGEFLSSVFFGDSNDTFADFFKCVRAWSGNPYYDMNIHNYPAIVMLFYKLAHRMIPLSVEQINGLSYRVLQQAWVSFFIYNAVTIWLAGVSIGHRLRLNRLNKAMLYLVLLMSFPVMFAFERANPVNLTFSFIMFYIAFYDDENPVMRELSLIALVLAACFKIYPALYGFLLLKKGNAKVVIRTVIYGIVLFFVPFLAYGRGTFMKFVDSLINFSGDRTEFYAYNFSLSNILRFTKDALTLGKPENGVSVTVAIVGILLFVSAVLAGELWEKLQCLALIIILVPSVSDAYLVLFLIPPFIELLDRMADPVFPEASTFEMCKTHVFLVQYAVLMTPLALPLIRAYSVGGYKLSYSYLVYFMIVVFMALFEIAFMMYGKLKHEKV